MEKTAAFFDFDGTVTFKDSFWLFLKHTVPGARLARGACALSPFLLAYLCGRYSNASIKEKVLTRFYGGWTREAMENAGRMLNERIFPGIVRPAALQRIAWHRERGHRLFLVTASPEEWTLPFARAHGMECVATRLEYCCGRLTGRLHGPNCHGPEKVRRIRELIPDVEEFETYAYGDTKGDLPMLEFAKHSEFRPFRTEN